VPDLPQIVTRTWVTAKMLAAESWGVVPAGYELTAVPDPGWVVDEHPRPCRRAHGRGTFACGRPSAAVVYRGQSRQPWGYCGSHMYGRWIEGGQVMHWILRAVSG
jgi:hypothetical protein